MALDVDEGGREEEEGVHEKGIRLGNEAREEEMRDETGGGATADELLVVVVIVVKLVSGERAAVRRFALFSEIAVSWGDEKRQQFEACFEDHSSSGAYVRT